MTTKSSHLKIGAAFAASLLVGSRLGFGTLAAAVASGTATAQAPAQATYELGYSGQTALYVGTVLGPWSFNGLIINRPSPGDDSWYRLKYTVEVIGTLPPGIQLVQNTGAFDLARFEGTPTEAGTFTVQLRATMEDGLVTSTTAVTFSVEDPRQLIVTPTLASLSSKPAGKTAYVAAVGFRAEGGLEGSRLLNLSGLVTVEAEGLPEGISVQPVSYDGYSFYLVGTSQAGTYPYTLRFKWSDGELLGEAAGTVEVLPADAANNYTLRLHFWNAARLEREYSSNPHLALYDDAYHFVQTVRDQPITYALSGLPEGLTFQDGLIQGTPKQSGTFSVTATARDFEGNVLAEEIGALWVQEAISATDAAGTYDSLIERSEANAGNGGRLLLTVTRTGRVTGTLLHNFQRYPFGSKSASFNGGTIRITPPRSGVVIEGFIDNDAIPESYNEDWSANPGYQFLGTMGSNELQAGISGQRAVARTASNPSPYANPNRVNLIFVRNPWSSPDQPAGSGFLSYRVAPSGVVTGTYWGADGSAPVSVATRISHTVSGGYFPLYLVTQNDSGKGSLSASLFLNERGDSAGQGSFYQPASDNGSFPEGISMVNYTGVIGSRYTPQPGNLNLLGLEEGIQNAELELEGAGLDQDLEVPVTVADTSTAIVAAATPEVSAVTARLNQNTGIVTGSLTLTGRSAGAKTVKFRAMVNPQASGAVGHFTLRGASRGVKAGSIKLVPKAH
jgi:hypothetical protein